MTITQVYIAGQLLDIAPKDVVALNKQINDIADISKRNADYTNRFTAPATPNNRRIAEMLNIPGNTSSRPYKYADAQIYSNGIPITVRAYALLVETKNRGAFDYVIYSGNYDLHSRILDKYITDLDWSDLKHIYNITTAVSTWANTEGYIYPLADTMNGALQDGTIDEPEKTVVQWKYQVPHVFVKTIWERIFTEAGLEYYGDFFDTNEKFLAELVPACRRYSDGSLDIRGETGYSPYIIRADSSPTYPPALPDPYTVNLGFSRIDNLNTDLYAQEENEVRIPVPLESQSPKPRNFTNFLIQQTGLYRFTISGKAILGNNHGDKATLQLLKNGAEVSGLVIRDTGASLELMDITEEDFTVYVNCEEGDIMRYAVKFEGHEDLGSGFNWSFVQYESLNMRLELADDMLLTNEIDFANYLPKVTQQEFLQAIMQQYGLLYRLDSEGKYHFTTMEDLLNGINGKADWTDKYAGETSETYRVGNYSKVNNVKYKYYDEDIRGDAYADSTFNIDIDDLPNEGDAISSAIEACGDWFQFQDVGMLAGIHAWDNTTSDPNDPPKYELRENNVLRTVLLKRATRVNNEDAGFAWHYDIDGTTTYPLLPFIAEDDEYELPYVQFSELHWDVLLEEYYPTLLKTMARPVKKKCRFWLTPVEIYSLNMFEIIYLEQYQSYFFQNKLNNFVPGKTTDYDIIQIKTS